MHSTKNLELLVTTSSQNHSPCHNSRSSTQTQRSIGSPTSRSSYHTRSSYLPWPLHHAGIDHSCSCSCLFKQEVCRSLTVTVSSKSSDAFSLQTSPPSNDKILSISHAHSGGRSGGGRQHRRGHPCAQPYAAGFSAPVHKSHHGSPL